MRAPVAGVSIHRRLAVRIGCCWYEGDDFFLEADGGPRRRAQAKSDLPAICLSEVIGNRLPVPRNTLNADPKLEPERMHDFQYGAEFGITFDNAL
jgi:hypothetical protein